MKTAVSLLIFTLFVFAAHAQSIQFEYDAAGNCVVKYKTVVMPSQAARHVPDEADGETPETGQAEIPASLKDVIGETEIVISPNPTKGILQIDFRNRATELSVNYRLTQMNGKHVTGGTATGNPLNLDLSACPAGIYLLRLTVEDKTETYKIIKQ